MSYGFSQSQANHTMFYKHIGTDKVMVFIFYVDDIILTGNDETGVTFVKKKLADDFQIKYLGTLKYFLGMKFARSKSGILVNQRKYIFYLWKETCLLGCRVAKTPIEQNIKLEAAAEKEKYQRLVGKLAYLTHTRPDIVFAMTGNSYILLDQLTLTLFIES